MTKLLPMGGGQSLRREWMALMILTAPGMTTNMASGVKLAKLFTLSMAGLGLGTKWLNS